MATKKRKGKRKSRTRLIKQFDITEPIDLSIIGTAEDPCFGKLYDPQASECKRCGDSEICAIAMGQNNHLKRALVEAEKNFKDLEEDKIEVKKDPKLIRKSIRGRVRKMVKMSAKNGVPFELVVNDIYASYDKDGYNKERIRKLINKMLGNSNFLKLKTKSNKLIWKTTE